MITIRTAEAPTGEGDWRAPEGPPSLISSRSKCNRSERALVESTYILKVFLEYVSDYILETLFEEEDYISML